MCVCVCVCVCVRARACVCGPAVLVVCEACGVGEVRLCVRVLLRRGRVLDDERNLFERSL